MRGLTGAEEKISGMSAENTLLRRRLATYIQTASDQEIQKLNMLIAQITDSTRWPQPEQRGNMGRLIV